MRLIRFLARRAWEIFLRFAYVEVVVNKKNNIINHYIDSLK